MMKKKGFTLIELLVVITIIGLLSTLAIFSLNAARAKTRDAKRMNDLKLISMTLERYKLDNNEYPINDNGSIPCGGKVVSKDGLICIGSPLSFDTEVYTESLPKPPLTDLASEFYLYDAENYNPPCVYTDTMEKEGTDNTYFWCQAGNCKLTAVGEDICTLGN